MDEEVIKILIEKIMELDDKDQGGLLSLSERETLGRWLCHTEQ